MKLDIQKFRDRPVNRRTKQIAVPELRPFFNVDESTTDVFLTIRQLTSNEIYLAKEQMEKNSPMAVLGKAISAGLKGEMAEQFKSIFNYDPDNTARDYTYRFYLVMAAVVDDEGKQLFDFEDVAKLGENFPGVFMTIANEVVRLCGEGPEVGEG